MLSLSRAFFADRGLIEVDVPILGHKAAIDAHIDPIQALCCDKVVYLHTSPEYGMKRLLSVVDFDIYQLSHVFRDHERGTRHTAEFMMAEWYRRGFSFKQMIDETIDYIALFLPDLPREVELFSYPEIFARTVGNMPQDLEERDRLYAFEIEPLLGRGKLSVIAGFPAEQAALAQLGENGLALRFEIYFEGVELANGYHELTDPIEQRRRLEQANYERVQMGKQELPIDEDFINALKQGVPDCCGVAVGFDRLMMLHLQAEEIRDVSCFFI